MAQEEEEIKSKTQFKFTFDELQEAFYNLIDESKRIFLKNKSLKSSNQALIKEKEELLKEKKIANTEIQNLKKEVEKYKSIVKKFIYDSEKLLLRPIPPSSDRRCRTPARKVLTDRRCLRRRSSDGQAREETRRQ